MLRSTQVYGIDTSVLVRLLTGHPEKDYERTVEALGRLHRDQPRVELVASNQVVGESYIALQHFYGISKPDATAALLSLLTSGNVSPLNGDPVLRILRGKGGAGLMDRLIAEDYEARGIVVLTNDKRMAKVAGAELLASM